MMDIFYPGQRVKLVNDVECYPLGIFPAGLLGTVEKLPKDTGGEVLAYIRFDEVFPALAEWENCIIVGTDGDEYISGPADWELAA